MVADILIIGSVAWDQIVSLTQPLSAGSHNEGRRLGERIGGGAANTGMALACADNKVLLISAVGHDPDGQRLLVELSRMGLNTSRVDCSAEQTTHSLVMLDTTGERTIVNLSRARVPLPPGLASIPADLCYVRSADPALTPILAERVRRGWVLAHVPPVSEAFRPAQVLVGSASDLDDEFLANPFAAGRGVAGAALAWVVVTDGPAGARAYGDATVIEQPAPVVTVADSTGAGDVFAAGLAHALARGAEMASALETAVAWGSASVTYEGTVPPPGFPPLVTHKKYS